VYKGRVREGVPRPMPKDSLFVAAKKIQQNQTASAGLESAASTAGV